MSDYDELIVKLRDDNACVSLKTLHEAADAIEELLQKMQQLPRWIPVTERLPKADEYDVRGYAVPYLVMNGWMRVTARRTKDYWVLFGEGKVLEYVTNWMPLPEPPKEES